jgi:hypothetical protein
MAAQTRQQVIEKIEYLGTLTESHCLDEAELVSVVETAKEFMVKALANSPPLDFAMATELMHRLVGTTFNSTQRSKISQAINANVMNQMLPTASGPSGNGRQALQSCIKFQHLMPTILWQFIQDRNKPLSARLATLCTFAQDKLGLISPNETTWVHIAAIFILLCSPTPEDAMKVDLGDGYVILRDLKAAMKMMRNRVKFPHQGVVLIYPNSPQELERDFPKVFQAAYENGQAEFGEQEFPFPDIYLDQLRSRLPARCSHQALMQVRPKKEHAASVFAQGLGYNKNIKLPRLCIDASHAMTCQGGTQVGRQPELCDRAARQPALCDMHPLEAMAAMQGAPPANTPHPSHQSESSQSLLSGSAHAPPGSSHAGDLGAGHAQGANNVTPTLAIGEMTQALADSLGGSKEKQPAANIAGKKKKPAANIAGKDKQAAKRPAANIAGNDSPQVKKHCKALPFPGKPKKTQPSIEFRGYTIVTDIPSGCWRVKQDGKHVTCASFACDPIKGWNKVTMTIFKK